MTQHDMAATLRAALERKADNAMTVTDTDRELDRLRGRPAPPAARVACASRPQQRQSQSAAREWDPRSPSAPAARPRRRSADRDRHRAEPASRHDPCRLSCQDVPSLRHVRADQASFTKHGKATLVDPRDDLPTVMAMTFRHPTSCASTSPISVARPSTATASLAPTATPWRAASFTLTPINDGCSQRRIPLSEESWGPIRSG